jgi:alpha-glucosidase
LKTLESWSVLQETPNGVVLLVEGRHHLRIEVLDQALFRVRLLKDGQWRLDRSWVVDPDRAMPWEGRYRDSLAGFACPSFVISQDESTVTVATDRLRVTVHRPLQLVWEALLDGEWVSVAEERPTGAHMLGVRDHRHAHFMARHPGEHVYGLGEKAGRLERSGRRYEMRNLDALGYNAETTDPLYKHIPFTITRTPKAGSFSLFYDNLAGCWFDLGNELDNYHKPYRAYRAADGDLDLYFAWSPDMLDLVKTQQWLTGGMAFPPRWTLGYSGSTMAYTDAPDAQAQLEGFVDKLAVNDIPCDSFQLSSGYTSIADKRYVFNWNTEKVPDPEGMAGRFAEAGLELVANIKPCLLLDHPQYESAAEKGLFIRDSETGQPEQSVFWDAKGSHLDFTNPATVDWWQSNVTTALLERGIHSTWNDNNEYEVWDHHARCEGFGDPIDIGLIRPLHSLLMVRSSEAAQRRQFPGKRPYLITRSGCAGLQRHAQTWTGDNHTDWATLRWNIRMGLGLALSGISNIGHDVGGFAGPRPEPELLLRWVQNGIFHPRFTIHSWNADGSVTEPWTHPQVLDGIREAIQLRYRLLPYLYTCLFEAVTKGEPMIRPTFLDHEHDASCFEETDDFMLGRDLLVASVVEEGASTREVYLPKNETGWWNFHEGTWHAPGTRLTLDIDLSSMPLFVRAGSVVPLAEGADRASPGAEKTRTLAVFPASDGGEHVSVIYDDLGDNADALDGNHCLTRVVLRSGADAIDLSLAHQGSFAFPFARLSLALPASEARSVRIGGAFLSHGDSFETGSAR